MIRNFARPALRVGAALSVAMGMAAFLGASRADARTVTLDRGTVIPVRLDVKLSSKDNDPGDAFTATVHVPRGEVRDGYVYSPLPPGTKIEGVVRDAEPKSGRHPGMLDLDFRKVQMPNGQTYPIVGSLIGLDAKSVVKTPDGRVIARPGNSTNRMAYVGYGAGAGLLVGALTHRPVRDTFLGAGLGALIGSLQPREKKARDVTLDPGTEIGVRLDRRLVLSDVPEGVGPPPDSRPTDGYLVPSKDAHYYRALPGDPQTRNAVREGSLGVMLNDNDVRFDPDARPMMIHGVAMVPVWPVLAAANIPYKFNKERQEIRAEGVSGVVRLGLGSRIAIVDDNRRVRLSAPAQAMNGTIYVPAKFFKLVADVDVTYDRASKTIVMATK